MKIFILLYSLFSLYSYIHMKFFHHFHFDYIAPNFEIRHHKARSKLRSVYPIQKTMIQF